MLEKVVHQKVNKLGVCLQDHVGTNSAQAPATSSPVLSGAGSGTNSPQASGLSPTNASGGFNPTLGVCIALMLIMHVQNNPE